MDRRVMFAILRHCGIPEPVVNAISALYKNSESAMVDGNISDTFEISTGVLKNSQYLYITFGLQVFAFKK